MTQNTGGGVAQEGGFHHFPRVDTGPVNGPPEKLIEGDNPVAVIEPENGKDFVFQVRQLEPQRPWS